MIKSMKTLIAAIQTNCHTCMLSLAGISNGAKKAAVQVASYWYSAVFYFGYFSHTPNRH
tara:strand:- start:1769 stop:1945 length:177 start_codon:yes stop_codon:yes gene_type:complete